MSEDAIIAAFDKHARWCDALGSPFTAALMRHLAGLLRQDGPLRALLPSWPGNPTHDALPLRLAGALHALVLAGTDARLAAAYPPAATSFDAALFGPALDAVLEREQAHFERWLAGPPQTNEVLRSAVLLGGFALIAERSALPLALHEIGASAGLNLHWDRFHYELSRKRRAAPEFPCSPLGGRTPQGGGLGGVETQQFGPATSAVRLASEWRGAAPRLPEAIEVVARAGCDVAPVNITAPGQALRLAAYVWPDQRERLARLQAAMALAVNSGVRIDRLAGACPSRSARGPRHHRRTPRMVATGTDLGA